MWSVEYHVTTPSIISIVAMEISANKSNVNKQPQDLVLLVSPHVMREQELSTLVVRLSFLLCVTLECHFEAVRKKIARSTVTGFSPLLEKVCFFCVVVSKKTSVAQRANFVRKCLEKNKRCLNSARKDSRRLYDSA